MKQFTLTLGIAAAALFSIQPNILAEDKPAGEKPKRPEGGRPGGRFSPEERLKHMTETLGLSQEQQDKLKAIFAKGADEMKALREKGRDKLTDEDKAKMKEHFTKQMEEINAVLTPEQKEKQKAEFEKRRGEGRPGGERKPGERKPDAAK